LFKRVPDFILYPPNCQENALVHQNLIDL
jgi:hypothetical protein